MIGNIFQVEQYSRWIKVTWPGRGAVRNPNIMYKIFEMAFQTGSPEVGFVSENGQIMYLDQVFYFFKEQENEGVYRALDRLRSLNGLLFATKEQADIFINIAEKHIVWRGLSRKTQSIGELM